MLAWPTVRILIDYRPALRERTGVGEYAHELANALASQLSIRDTLTLFSSSWKDRLSPGVIPGVPIVDARVPVSLLNLSWHRLEWPVAETFAGDIDVTHSMHPLLMPARNAARVVTVHDLYFLDSPERTAAEIRRDYPALTAEHTRRAEGVITVSEYTAGMIVSKLSVPRDAITLCPPGAPDWRPVDRYASGGPILFMGTIEPRKNVGTLLRAYGRLVSMKPSAPPLKLAGKIAPACEGIADEIRRPPLAGRVEHVGYVSGPARELLYREASMLVLPSYDEGFGLPVLEAMTIGVPVIASRRGALPEVAGDAGILVDPDDHEGFAAAMARILDDPAQARRRGEAGIDRAKRFTWRESAARLMTAYAAAIERRRGRS
jgi:glycosyltransferase involved in cell wall biosynthesis